MGISDAGTCKGTSCMNAVLDISNRDYEPRRDQALSHRRRIVELYQVRVSHLYQVQGPQQASHDIAGII